MVNKGQRMFPEAALEGFAEMEKRRRGRQAQLPLSIESLGTNFLCSHIFLQVVWG